MEYPQDTRVQDEQNTQMYLAEITVIEHKTWWLDEVECADSQWFADSTLALQQKIADFLCKLLEYVRCLDSWQFVNQWWNNFPCSMKLRDSWMFLNKKPNWRMNLMNYLLRTNGNWRIMKEIMLNTYGVQLSS